MMAETRLLLVRHGSTEDFEAGRLQGQRRNGGLSALGRQQVARLAESLRGMKIVAIYSSDLARAAETAEILRGAVNAPLEYDPRLRELDFGQWEGKTRAELRTLYPNESFPMYAMPHVVTLYGGETLDALFTRTHAVYTDILAQHAGAQVMIVAHAHALSALMYGALGLPISETWAFGLEPAHTATLLISREGRAFLSRLNTL